MQIASSLKVIDKDHSGKISYDEFKKWWAQKDRFEVLKDEQENQQKAEEWAGVRTTTCVCVCV